MATGSNCRMLLPEPFTGSNDLESYVTRFELLAEIQKWKRLYRTLPQATGENYDECIKAFREHYGEKPVVFRGRLARRVQQSGEKLTDFLGDLKQLALKAYPTESQGIRDHLVLRRFLEGINHSQVKLDLGKQIGDKDMTIQTVLERALHLEAVTGIEEDEQTPKVAVIRRDETKDLVEAVTKLVNQLSVDDKQRENRQNQFREEEVPGDGGVTTEVTEDSNKIVGLMIGGDFQRQDLVTETDLLEERNRLGGTTGRVSSAEPVNKSNTF